GLAEMLNGSFFGPCELITGGIHGLGSESGFFVTGYKRYDTLTLFYSAIGTTIFSYVYVYFKFGYGNYALGMNIALISVRFVSICFF
ncbi:ECF transporter S component, partial [Enterococcus faecalis]|uniref:ECF transporter S component n=1 Tax=Enterococcus faecalis TaxID=1351 RepID=UPI003CC5D49D